MKHLLPNDKNDTISSVFANDGSGLISGKAAANEINKYFCNISTDLESKLPKQKTSTIYPSEVSATYISYVEKITINELLKEIKLIDITKSSGFKDINTKILKVILPLHLYAYCILQINALKPIPSQNVGKLV